ncbi:glycosyltransferase family 4 protein [Thalassotalea mangrovi]|uniref:Glycosyltransferase family 4 protein n=1 Tax=Thalassotalea mangrovi TaxID=2572245 RepID=A0A4V6WMK9_9GAMM|nr:glycosyltransferase family 4 protein [Thalassotalea mangrovi]TKB46146.1 glycosyltransferase family 4 protein [Thalassotalea mangrovi]
MNIFVIPAWHPTPEKPHLARWVMPHIEVSRRIGTVTVLHVEQSHGENEQVSVSQEHDYYYAKVNIEAKNIFRRTIIGYGKSLVEYTKALKLLYEKAVAHNGKPDIIHAHVSAPAGFSAARIGRDYGVPVIVTEHYSGFFSDNRFFWRLPYFSHQMRRSIKGLYAVSPGFKASIENKCNIEVNGVLPNPIDTSLFKPKVTENKSSVLKIVSTGTVGSIKGTDILLKAISRLPKGLKYKLKIIGNYDFKDKEINELLRNPHVELLGHKMQSELASIYSNSDLFIVSSRIETANVSMLEAMSCGCYVIAPKINAPETLLSETVSSIYEAKNIDDLVKNIETLPSFSREKQRQFVIENYGLQSVTRQLKRAYKRALIL